MAQRARVLAHDVPDDVMSARLLEIAAELEAQPLYAAAGVPNGHPPLVRPRRLCSRPRSTD
jgi:hypothetical protein